MSSKPAADPSRAYDLLLLQQHSCVDQLLNAPDRRHAEAEGVSANWRVAVAGATTSCRVADPGARLFTEPGFHIHFASVTELFPPTRDLGLGKENRFIGNLDLPSYNRVYYRKQPQPLTRRPHPSQPRLGLGEQLFKPCYSDPWDHPSPRKIVMLRDTEEMVAFWLCDEVE